MTNKYPLVIGNNNIEELQNSDVFVANNTILGTNTTIGLVTPSEISYLHGVTSSIQSQIDSISSLSGILIENNSANATFANTINIVGSGAIVTNNNSTVTINIPGASSDFSANNAVLGSNTTIGLVTPSEISYLHGVTSSIQSQIDSKANSTSPIFSGIPQAPTANIGTNDNQIATTAFVENTISSINSNITIEDNGTNPVVTNTLNIVGTGATISSNNSVVTIDIPGQTATNTVLTVGTEIDANYIVKSSDNNFFYPVGSGNLVITIPTGLPANFVACFMQNSSSTFTIQGSNGVILDSPQGLTSQGLYSSFTILCLSADTFLVTIGSSTNKLEQLSDVGISTPKNGDVIVYKSDTNAWVNSIPPFPRVFSPSSRVPVIFPGCNNSTYVQSGNTVTVTFPSHGMTSALNGMSVFLTSSSNTFVTQIIHCSPFIYYDTFTNFTYVDANTFICTSSMSKDSSGTVSSVSSQYQFYPVGTITIPSNTIGTNGLVKAFSNLYTNGSSNNKKLGLYFQTQSSILTSTMYNNPNYLAWNSGSQTSAIISFDVLNHGANSQYWINNYKGDSVYGVPGQMQIPSSSSIDTTQDTIFTFAPALTSNSDWSILANYYLEII